MRKCTTILSALAAISLGACSDQPITAPTGNPSFAVATAPGQNKLQCFAGPTDLTIYGGSCTINSNGAKGSATLDLSDGDADGEYAGVYTLESTVYGALLTDLTQLSYHYSASTTPLPGNLSYNIPIDEDGNGSTDFYAFVDAFYCPGTNGVVNITTDAACGIWAENVQYPNWAALLAAYPGARVATDAFVFVVAQRTPAEPLAVYTVSNVKFGKAGK
jgi:hypothetical protein